MERIESYRLWYEQEKAANAAMLAMIGSVPDGQRSDARYSRALTLAAHLAACRENWLDRMTAGGIHQSDWWPDAPALPELAPRYAALEASWSRYLASLTEDELDVDFEYPAGGGVYRWNIEGQIVQLVGHAFYHRGQIALLVSQLGGVTEDTDYLFWAFKREPNRWGQIR